MVSTQDDGVYTKTAAYNLIKGLVGIKPKDILNKQVFNLCFSGQEQMYRPRRQESEIVEIFRKHRISELNKKYWELKKQKSERAREIFDKTISLLESEFAKEAA